MRRLKPKDWRSLTAEELVGAAIAAGHDQARTPDEVEGRRRFLNDLGYTPLLWVRARRHVRLRAEGRPYEWEDVNWTAHRKRA
ncbi:MAG: hypothetical protein WKF79_03350 [Nocardioides sp.]